MPDEPDETTGPSGPSERGAQGSPEPGNKGPTALPPAGARGVAFVAILVAGACGFLIGRALVLLQCKGCAVEAGVGGLIGAVMAAAGVAVIAVLVLRAMGEWHAGPDQRRS